MPESDTTTTTAAAAAAASTCGLWFDSSSSSSIVAPYYYSLLLETFSSSTFTIFFFLLSFCYLLYSKLAHQWHVFYMIRLWLEFLIFPVRNMHVEMTDAELYDDGVKASCTDAADADAAATSNNTNNNTNNKSINAKKGQIACYDPSTGQYLGSVVAMTPEQVNEACAKAVEAQNQWKHTTFRQRRAVLRTLQQYILQHVTDICRVSARDSGKSCLDACLGEVLTTTEKIRCINWNGELWLQPSYRSTGPLMVHKTAVVEYVPLGVIAPIAPWNYPFHNFMNHIISGIFAGNAVVGKVSEHTSWSSQYFTRMVRTALQVHGHNPDLCQTITGFGDAGAALVQSTHVDKIIFTGSPAIGKKVMQTASQYLKPVILELGGKDAMVILDDCKLQEVLPWVMRGCFQNCGQNCVGIERVLVYESIYDEFLQAVTPLVQKLRQGVPLATCGADGNVDCGSLVMPEQLDIIQSLVDDAIQKGAKLVCGGKRHGQQQFYQPTIVADVTPDMRIYQEELFGPVMTVVKVPKDDDATAVAMVNQSRFGLGSSVYCTNQRRGLAIARQIRSGMTCVNDFGSNYLVQALPFGGVKDSGFGRFAGPEGLQALCLERSILTDRIPGVKTTIPSPLNYPVNKERAMGFADSLLQLLYNESWWTKIKAIFGLIKYG